MSRRDAALFFGGMFTALGVSLVVSMVKLSEKPRPRPAVVAEPPKCDDDGGLAEANQNLVAMLQQCDRSLASLREQANSPEPVASAAAPPAREERRRVRAEPTSEDWERMASLGQMRLRTPCLRDTPWQPSERAIESLGLAPEDVAPIREAYEASNKRMSEQLRPLCASVLGSSEAAEKIGVKMCADVISNSARTDPSARDSIAKVALTNAGKRNDGAASDGSPLEKMLTTMSAEMNLFEADLARSLGPDEAKRLAWSQGMCTDRHVVRAGDATDEEGAGEQRGRGGRGAPGGGEGRRGRGRR